MTQSHSPNRQEPPFSSALLLAEQETSAAVDKVTLRSAGIPRLRYAASGLDVAAHLAERVSKILLDETEVIVCLPKFKDITAAQFAHLVRSHPLLTHIPLLAIAADPALVAPLRQSGFNEVVLRPFNTTTLSNKLYKVAAESRERQAELLDFLRDNPGIPSDEEFRALLTQYAPISHEDLSPIASYKQGVKLMRNYHWDEALPFLEKAATDRRMQGNAFMALSAFWTVHQDMVRVEACLRDALQAFLDDQQWDKARHAAQRLLEEFPGSANPILPELERRARQNQHETVAALASLAKKIGTPDEDIAAVVIMGSQASLTPTQTLPTMASVLRIQGFERISELISEASGLNEQPRRKRWAWFTSRPDKTIAPPEIAAAEAEEDADSGGQRGIPLKEEERGPASSSATSGGSPRPDSRGRVITPLGDDVISPYLQPSPLGDVWTVMRGTLRLSKKKK